MNAYRPTEQKSVDEKVHELNSVDCCNVVCARLRLLECYLLSSGTLNLLLQRKPITAFLPHHHTTVLRLFFRDHPGEPVPEENLWTLWCKGRLTEADTLTIWLGATPSELTSAHLHHPTYFLQAGCPSCRPTNTTGYVVNNCTFCFVFGFDFTSSVRFLCAYHMI